ncbi:MAG: N-acetylneuraminate synthase [Magnetococcales bacterium]|nr:N-acetylneuraminate synthase [Magnetococcales bacterium]
MGILCPGRCVVIAEAGVNHNGSQDMALKLVDAAAAAGADAVKFQTFKADSLVSRRAPKAAYQRITTDPDESQWAMIQRLELDVAAHRRLQAHCQAAGIAFLSSPFDLESLNFLLHDLHLGVIKIPSGELTNGPLLLAAGRSGQEIILSTGMATLAEIETALGVLAFGLLGVTGPPGRVAFQNAFVSPAGGRILREQARLLHCTTEYPAPFAEVNLRGMEVLREAFGLPTGYSDHTEGVAVAIAAVARGAVVVEKHFTLDRDLPGPDHRASLEPEQLAVMIRGIREVEAAMGDGRKVPTPAELKNRDVARKSLVALQDIPAGTLFSEENLGARRPGGGLSPMEWWSLLGRPAARDYARDQEIV